MSNNESARKGMKEAFAQFFENPTRLSLKSLLQENYGESDQIDFKQEWVLGPALARHILGFANSGGGVIVAGVGERADKSLVSDGLASLVDKTDVINSVKKFLPNHVQFDILNFQFEESEYASIKGKKFQVLLVEDSPDHLPFLCVADGEGIRKAAIYARIGVSTTEASHEHLQRILNRRIATTHSTGRELALKDHLDELQVLYSAIPYRIPNPMFSELASFANLDVRNPFYPKEDFASYIARMIDLKKKVIEGVLATRYLNG